MGAEDLEIESLKAIHMLTSHQGVFENPSGK